MGKKVPKGHADLQLPKEACCEILMTPGSWRWKAKLLIEEETVHS